MSWSQEKLPEREELSDEELSDEEDVSDEEFVIPRKRKLTVGELAGASQLRAKPP